MCVSDDVDPNLLRILTLAFKILQCRYSYHYLRNISMLKLIHFLKKKVNTDLNRKLKNRIDCRIKKQVGAITKVVKLNTQMFWSLFCFDLESKLYYTIRKHRLCLIVALADEKYNESTFILFRNINLFLLFRINIPPISFECLDYSQKMFMLPNIIDIIT